MSKPVHPIRRAAWGILYRTDHSQVQIERRIARHVKPLLDALERLHPALQTLSKTGHRYYRMQHDNCHFCRLLAAWRAKL